MPTDPAAFHAFSPSHYGVLVACAVVLLLLALLRYLKPDTAVWAERTLGTILLLIWPITVLFHWQKGSLDLNNGLPFHLCDIASVAGGLALWTRRQFPCEIVYFVGLAGTLQGLITPNLKVDYPDPRFVAFFILHGGVVVTAVHVVTSMKHAPRAWSSLRMLLLTMAYAAVVGGVNAVLKTNYAFVCHKPEQASLMDVMPAWPWYIGWLVVICALFYGILEFPFAIARWVRARRG